MSYHIQILAGSKIITGNGSLQVFNNKEYPSSYSLVVIGGFFDNSAREKQKRSILFLSPLVFVVFVSRYNEPNLISDALVPRFSVGASEKTEGKSILFFIV